MEALAWVILAMTVLAARHIFSKFANDARDCRRKFPPGPKPWPIIGNLNLIGPLPHRSLHKLSEKYGDIMQLKFGSFPVVIASSAEMAKQFLKTHDHIFAARPPSAAGKYTAYNSRNMTWSHGPHWRHGRKIFLMELFSKKRLESYEYIRVEERQAFISRLYKLHGKQVLLRDHLMLFNLSAISRFALGKNYFGETNEEKAIFTFEVLQEILDELFFLIGVLNIGDWIPWVSFLDLQGYVKRMKAMFKKFDLFLDHVLDDHRARRQEGNDFVAKDIVDLLLKLADDHTLEVEFNTDCVKAFTQDIIAGSTDTSATTVEWALSEVVKHPYVMKKATKELDRVIGKDRWVEERDITQLPYIDAIIRETMRLHPVAVLLIPHLALEDCNVAGYDIRKGTRVFVNTHSIGRDPAIWDAPEEFRPERFLGKGFDVKEQNFELLPFGSGRRMCPGYSLGLKMIWSSLANVLHGFDLKLPPNMKTSMEEVFGLVITRKFPLVAVMEPRLPAHLYQLPK